MGTEIVNKLIKNHIFISDIEQKQPIIKINKNLRIPLIASARFYKPPLMKGQDKRAIWLQTPTDGETTFAIRTKTSDVHQGIKFYSKITGELKTLLDTSLTRYTINADYYTQFTTYIAEVISSHASGNINNLPLLLNYYGIDFKEVLANCGENIAIVKELVDFALNINEIYSPDLQHKYEQDNTFPAYRQIYYIISAYKFFFKGLLNDLNIYRRFSYFYIPKFVATSLRCYSKGFFLNLQGHKLVHCFMLIKAPVNNINKENFSLVKTIMKKHLPFTQDSVFGDDLTYSIFVKDTAQYLELFVIDNLVPTTNLSEYANLANFNSQLTWLSQNLKPNKLDKIFIMQSRLNHYFNPNAANKFFYEINALNINEQEALSYLSFNNPHSK